MKTSRINIVVFLLIIFVSIFINNSSGEIRFPQPDFESGYSIPGAQHPGPGLIILEYLDIIVLIACLLIASWLALKKRSRLGMFFLMIFSIIYFGFYKKGCVCSVGSIQNIAAALFNSSYTVPITVLIFFIVPLVFTLFFGRTFCAAVCPLGAVQDLVILRPQKINPWLENALGIIPYLYFGLAVLYAANGIAFIICRFDPFVSFFRLSGNPVILVYGLCFLITGIFIARPYCRFFCPYSVLLRIISVFSHRHLTITPDECIKCRLCEESCPFNAIRKPQEKINNKINRARIRLMIILMPIIIAISAFSFSRMSGILALSDNKVRLASYLVSNKKSGNIRMEDELRAFQEGKKTRKELFEEVSELKNKIKTGSWWLGAFLGFIIALKLVFINKKRESEDYEPDKADCLSCGRCFSYCPRTYVAGENSLSSKTSEINVSEINNSS